MEYKIYKIIRRKIKKLQVTKNVKIFKNLKTF